MINTKRPNTSDYIQVGFIEAKDTQGNYQNIDHIYDSQGNIVFQQGYLNEYQGADNFSIPAIGKPLIVYTIYGNMVQTGTPTPDNPMQPSECGDRTENLFDKTQPTTLTNKYLLSNGEESSFAPGWAASAYIPVSGDYVTLSGVGGNLPSICAYDSNKQFVRGINYGNNNRTTINISDCSFVRFSYVPTVQGDNTMLNLGSTALPYEPYGYKLDISSASTTTPVYLGEVETTRRIKKLVLTGGTDEEYVYDPSYTRFYFVISNMLGIGVRLTPLYCTHYQNISDGRPVGDVPNNSIYTGGGIDADKAFIKTTDYTSVPDFKAYLAAQYANGTPVTVWYVLTTEETGIVNEPLRKIGDYADTLSMEQAGVEIPTLNKPNNTVIDVETEVEPSEVDVTYRGSTKPKYNLFLAQNGDSFEAKDGQSLYIGGGL